MKTWVMIADAARARFFRVAEGRAVQGGSQYAPAQEALLGALVEIKDLSHPQSLHKASEMASDAPGVVSVPGMHSKFGVEEKTSPKEEEVIRFAKEVAEALRADVAEYDRLYVVAPPHFLGLLRDRLDKVVRAKVVEEIAKELTHFPAEQIRERLPARL